MPIRAIVLLALLTAIACASTAASAREPESTWAAIVSRLETERALFEKVVRENGDKLRKDLQERERAARRAGDNARADALAAELGALTERGAWPASAPPEDARRLRLARQRLDEQFTATIELCKAARFGGADMHYRQAVQEREWYASENALIPWSSLLPDADIPPGWTREGSALVADGEDKPRPLTIAAQLPRQFRLEIVTSADPKHAALGYRLKGSDQTTGRLDVAVGTDGALDAKICPGSLESKVKGDGATVALSIIRRASHSALEVGPARLLDLRTPCDKAEPGPAPALTITPEPRVRLRIEALRVRPILPGPESLPSDTRIKNPDPADATPNTAPPAIAPPILAGAPQYLQAKSQWQGTLDRDSERDLPITATVASVDEESRTIVLNVKIPNQRETWTLNYTGVSLTLTDRTGGKTSFAGVVGSGVVGQQGLELRYECKRSGAKRTNQPEKGVIRLKPK